MKCCICDKEITGSYFQANINKELKETDNGDIVCSEDCKTKYSDKLIHCGQAIDNYSRITGYYQNVDGWNNGKLQELKERKRYVIPK